MKILLLAGEQSGLIYADAVKNALRQDAQVRTFSDYGFATADLAVIGIWAVLRRLPYFLRVMRTMRRAIDEWRPDVVCTIDYPGMNLRLAAYAKSRGIRAVHVVCPQVWAWKKGRIPRIVASLDRLLCFFPFEPELFPAGFAAFVGHPLAEQFAALRGEHPANEPAQRLVALLPGSRLGEIERILPTLLDAAALLRDVKIEIPAANPRARAAIDRILATRPHPGSIRVTDGGARDLLMRASVAAVASGTATLEAALARCPTVLVYRVHPLLAALARRLITGVRHLGLANIIWEKTHKDAKPGDFPMPELLQEDFTPQALAHILSDWLDNNESRNRAVAALDATCRLLYASSDGAASRIAAEISSHTAG